MLLVSESYELALNNAGITPLATTPTCRMVSSVSGQVLSALQCTTSYWKENMVSTVRFSAALTNCLTSTSESTALVELGPHPALQAPTKEVLRSLKTNTADLFHSCIRGKDDMESMLDSAGTMIASRVPLNLLAINAQEVGHDSYDYGNVLTDLPTYAWNHSTPIWSESRISRNIRFRQVPHHELLGSRYLEDIPSSPSWRNVLVLKEAPWLQKHKEVCFCRSLKSSATLFLLTNGHYRHRKLRYFLYPRLS